MTPDSSRPPIGLLFSGGLDSAILLATLSDEGGRVQPFYVRSQLVWESAELRAVRRYLNRFGGLSVEKLVILDLPLGDLYEDHWSLTGRQPPDASTADEAVYLPGRNALLLVKAALWCQLHGIEQLALAVLGSNPFADATPDFFDSLQSALNCGPDGRLRIVRPFARLNKQQVMRLGGDLPLELTFSCIAPVDGLHCGRCNKCAERKAAFRLVGRKDLTPYAAPLTTRF
jgi:7-cyano-7-deazaguanine synthase